MSNPIRIIIRHELAIIVATRRALAAAALYLVTALLGGVGYVKSLQAMQRQAEHALGQQGVDPAKAAAAVSRATHAAYAQLVSFLAGTDGAEVATSLTSSVILPAYLWGSLAFLPFLVVITSFDAMASDLQVRSLCYSVLRVPRALILAGKLFSQMILFLALSVLASLTLSFVAAALLDDFDLTAVVPGLARSWLVLLPYGFCYLSLAMFCSASVRQPSLALLASLGLMVLLRALALFSLVPSTHALSVLRPLRWLSPAQYQSGFWEQGLAGPLLSVLAYLAFSAVFSLLAKRALERQDL